MVLIAYKSSTGQGQIIEGQKRKRGETRILVTKSKGHFII